MCFQQQGILQNRWLQFRRSETTTFIKPLAPNKGAHNWHTFKHNKCQFFKLHFSACLLRFIWTSAGITAIFWLISKEHVVLTKHLILYSDSSVWQQQTCAWTGSCNKTLRADGTSLQPEGFSVRLPQFELGDAHRIYLKRSWIINRWLTFGSCSC